MHGDIFKQVLAEALKTETNLVTGAVGDNDWGDSVTQAIQVQNHSMCQIPKTVQSTHTHMYVKKKKIYIYIYTHTYKKTN